MLAWLIYLFFSPEDGEATHISQKHKSVDGSSSVMHPGCDGGDDGPPITKSFTGLTAKHLSYHIIGEDK